MSAGAYALIGTLGAAGITGLASIMVALLRTRGELRPGVPAGTLLNEWHREVQAK